MSYEVYEQHICANGHYFTCEESYGGYFGEDGSSCPICKAPSVWCNCVDQTNGPSEGETEYDDLVRNFQIKEEVIETCNLGHQHLKEPAIFRIPTREETKPFRKYSPMPCNIADCND